MYLGVPYYIESPGEVACKTGAKILTVQECRIACQELEKSVGALKTGKICYIAKNGKCRQDGRQGSKTSLVCAKEGNI